MARLYNADALSFQFILDGAFGRSEKQPKRYIHSRQVFFFVVVWPRGPRIFLLEQFVTQNRKSRCSLKSRGLRGGVVNSTESGCHCSVKRTEDNLHRIDVCTCFFTAAL